ncbi:DUF6143 family protein [Candidatus Formimonas warabiya]|uniref:Uncharacterized protein n=1 Tax=Formimonas warabiya TaxID=1761012 RepID=A0A3G1KN14_FORW1|nr:DUF6143 family protein [Candidatus Formimonas warabiya]ATW23853.1 hypothetical protein DCMF_02710 [Candidatus Formimonas warabiya]
MTDFKSNYTPCIFPNSITQVADMPYALYLSLQGKYFVGYAPDVQFVKGKYGWAGLVNPDHSCVNLHVYVWTVTNFGESPLSAEIWFNTNTPENSVISEFTSPANTAICPLPRPKVGILQANNVSGHPQCGNRISVKKVLSEVTIVGEEVGRFIFPPGGSFSVLLSNAEASSQSGIANLAFGWWEEEIK